MPQPRSRPLAPVAVRLAVLLIVGLVAFKGVQALLFPPDLLSAATVEQIEVAVRARAPKLTPAQIERFIQSLRELRGDPSLERAVEEARKGNTRVAQGVLLQIYENAGKTEQHAHETRAKAARDYAASAVVNDVKEGLDWYRRATDLDPDSIDGWLGLADAAITAGVLDVADEGYRKCIELATSTRNEYMVVECLEGHGTVLEAQGNLPDALESFRHGQAASTRLEKSDADSYLATLDEQIGHVLVAQGNLPRALESFRHGKNILAHLNASNTRTFDEHRVDLLRDLALFHEQIGDVLVAQGNLPEALKSLRDGQKILLDIGQSDRDNRYVQRDLAVFQIPIGDVLVAQGNLVEALKSYRDAQAISRHLIQSDHGNSFFQDDLATSHDRIGGVLLAQGNLADALTSFRDGQTIWAGLRRSDPAAIFQHSMALSYGRIGDVLVQQGNLADALKPFRDGQDILARITQSNPNNAAFQHSLGLFYQRIGDVLVKQGNQADSLKALREAIAITEPLARLDPSNANWQRDLSASYNLIGDVLVAQRNLGEAVKLLRDAFAIRERLARADPSDTRLQYDLAVSYDSMGTALIEQGDLTEALKSFQNAFTITEHLVHSDPSNAIWQEHLVLSEGKLAANGDDAPARWNFIATTLRKLKEERRLTPGQEKLLSEAETELAKAR